MRVLVILAALGLSSCVQPYFEGANERGGIVRIKHGTPKEAFDLADAHCRRYGRVARVTNITEFPYTLLFSCE